MVQGRPFRVLSLDGGGMRGTYTATYLSCLAADFAKKRGVAGLDVGAAFDLIVGTSTGGIIACALAAGVPLSDVVRLYRQHGPAIFPMRLPEGLGLGLWRERTRPQALASGARALQAALQQQLGNITIGEVYARRKIALAIPAVEMSQHRSWVFKTPHLARLVGRDDHYRLVDVCLATTAAPVYRSLAAIDRPDGGGGFNVFADGGLWANNPVLVGLIDALDMTGPGDAIEIFCLGTCPRPAGEQIAKMSVHRSLVGWKFGGHAAALAIDAQEFAFDFMARKFAEHANRACTIIRFPREQVPAALMPYLDLDDTRPEAADALINQARSDADMTNSKCGDPSHRDGQYVKRLFMETPVLQAGS